MYAFIGRLLRVNLSEGRFTDEEITEEFAKTFVGGQGFGSKYFYDEVPKGCDPLGPENKLMLMTGPLTGTASPSAGRYSVVAMSPATGMWGHANSGGEFGTVLKRSGYDGIIFEGISPSPVYLVIDDGKVELRPASHLWGKPVTDVEDQIRNELGARYAVASIGPAGENLVRFAAIMNDKHRAAGRCGLGAVLGSKRLKAIAVKGTGKIQLADPDKFREVAKKQYEVINESLLKVGFESFGTNMVSDMVNAKGGYPTRNWQTGVFDGIEEINGQALSEKVLTGKKACFACPIACGRGTAIKDGPWEGHEGEGPEYESVNVFGGMCCVGDMNAVTMANFLCNEYGLDTISTGSCIAFAMECYEKGILTEEMTGGVPLNFGDGPLVVNLVKKIALREGVGDLIAEGTRLMAKKLGRNSLAFAMQVKGLELPAYDPRAAKICGLGYVTANRGGCHMSGYVQGPTFIDTPWLLVEDSKIQDVFVANPKEAKVLVDLENALTVFDCIGACKFMGFLVPAEEYADLIAAATGWNFSATEFRKTGERLYNMARSLCVREGITREDDRLPDRLYNDPLPSGPAKGMVIERETLEMMKDAYYGFRVWDIETGKPSIEKLKELGLEFVIKDVWPTHKAAE